MTVEQAAALRKEFPPGAIGQLPKGGALLDYVGHAATTDRLLSVDPNWTWEPFATDERGLPALDGKGNLWIRLTVCGHTRIGVGDGKTAKECIGDAIRNAAMRFGVALDLWSKEELEQATTPKGTKSRQKAEQAPVQAEPTRPMSRPGTSPARRKMFALLNETGRKDRDAALGFISGVLGIDVQSTSDISEEQVSTVIKKMEGEQA